jgi:8-oxo-dGTP pyrophosphatase MutT (NUDIX family)
VRWPLRFESVLSPYLQRIRRMVGHELLLLPSVALLPWDDRGRLLLVREKQTGLWQTVGGAVEPDESPAEAALREAAEEASVVVRLTGIRAVLGGPEFRMTYPNGDLVGYVSTVYDAQVIDGEPHADGDETIDVGWFSPDALEDAELSAFTHTLFEAVGIASSAGRGASSDAARGV